jgi:hypothetical protein
MLETPHAVFGALIATKIGNPWVALPLAFASHFVLEPLPHWNPHTNTEIRVHGQLSNFSLTFIAADVLTSLGLGLWLASRTLPDVRRFLLVIAACFLAVLPDLLEAPYFIFGSRHPFFQRLISFQKRFQYDISWFPGLIIQTLIVFTLINFALH